MGLGKSRRKARGRRMGRTEMTLTFFLVEKEKKCYHITMQVNTTAISTENIKTHMPVPVISETGRGTGARRDDRGDAGSGKALPTFLAAFDDVRISSQKKTGQAADDRIVVYMPATVTPKPVKTEKKTNFEMAVNRTPAATDSEIVRDGRAVGPYNLNVKTMAMKRYGEASSYRNWHPTTFEIVI